MAVPGQGDGSISGLDLGDPRRPVDLIFVHANGFNAATYRFLLEPLAGDARILAPDLRGHGRSRLPADPVWRRNWHDFRDDLIALIDAVDGPPVVLAGHSMGAVVALLAAERRQHRVRSVVMFDPVILPRPASLMMSWPLAGRMARRYPLVAGALRRRARFDSRNAAIEAYRGRGAFRDWPEQALADYVAEGFRDVEDGVELVCAPEMGSVQLRRPGARPLARPPPHGAAGPYPEGRARIHVQPQARTDSPASRWRRSRREPTSFR